MLPVRLSLNGPLNFRWRATQLRLLHIKRAELYEKCCHILGVEQSADQNTVRSAYIDLVKKLHPDSGQPEASVERFQIVDEAFKVLQEKFAKNRRGIYEEDEDEVPDIQHTAPQHRQYLNFDGVGIGNPFQRQKQYQQVKVMKAQMRILNYRVDKSQAGERTVMKKGTFFKNHAIKTKYGFERVVEDLIQEAMSKGDFNNLSGAGKPITTAQTQNPYVDFTTHKLNKILQNNGFTPEWIMLQRDIREAVAKLKTAIKDKRAFFGEYPLTEQEDQSWQQLLKPFEDDVRRINKDIDKYNLIVPIVENQLFRLNLTTLSNNILQDPKALKNFKRQQMSNTVNSASGTDNSKSDLFSFISSLF